MKRNYGLDLLRLVSMLLIVTLHLMRRGGVMAALDVGSARYWVCSVIECFAYCTINRKICKISVNVMIRHLHMS